LSIISKSNKVILFGNFFFKKEISDTAKNTEAIVALSAQSREEVDQMMDKVVDAGGRESRDPPQQEDYAWMYGRYFEDLNGHLWGIFYMDESAMKKG
jgi:predicted lactoylglutathione lyase